MTFPHDLPLALVTKSCNLIVSVAMSLALTLVAGVP